MGSLYAYFEKFYRQSVAYANRDTPCISLFPTLLILYFWYEGQMVIERNRIRLSFDLGRLETKAQRS